MCKFSCCNQRTFCKVQNKFIFIAKINCCKTLKSCLRIVPKDQTKHIMHIYLGENFPASGHPGQPIL